MNRIAVLWCFIKVYVHTVIMVVVALFFAVCFIKVYVVTVIVFWIFSKISVSENIQKCDFVEK